MVPGFFFRVATDAFGVSCGNVDRAARIPSVVSGEEGKLFEGELESVFLLGVLGGYPGAGRSRRGGWGRSLRGVGGVRCSLGGPVWWPVAGWVWGSGTACLDLCTACPRAFIGGALWPGVSGAGAAAGCGVGCPVARVRALGCGWCSGVWPACLRVHCRMRSGVTPV